MPSLPVRNMIEALGRAGEATADDLATELGYSRSRVYTFIEEARSDGTVIVAVPHPGETTTFRLPITPELR